MLVYALKRTLIGVLILVVVSMLAFSMTHLSGDPAMTMAGESASAEDIETIRRVYGLDAPIYEQYLRWAKGALTGDLGQSHHYGRPVLEVVADRLPITMTLGAAALAFALMVAIPLGVLAAVRPNSMIDRVALLIAVVGQALPTFWFALMMIILFGVTLRILPISGNDSWKNFVMPAIALGYYATPALMRLTRAGMIEALSSDYVRTAHAMRIGHGSVLFKHALRNALAPVVSVAAVQFGFMLGGSVVIEQIFSLQGLGWLAYDAILRADLPVIQAVVLTIACFYVVLTLLADILNAFLDPRIRVG